MTHYSRFWTCRTCGNNQESMCYPSVYVCERCIRPLANKLCRETLKTDLGPGIDDDYFLRRAYDYAEILLGRKQMNPPPPQPLRPSPMVGETKR